MEIPFKGRQVLAGDQVFVGNQNRCAALHETAARKRREKLAVGEFAEHVAGDDFFARSRDLTRGACGEVSGVRRIRSACERGGGVGDVGATERFGHELLREAILGAQTHEAVEVAERHSRFVGGTQAGGKIREGYRFPNKDSGKVKYLAAKRAVVLCYGGFSADAQFRQIYDPKLTNKFDTTNQPGATSEGWRAAMAIGAHVIQADQIQILPQTCPDEKGFGIGFAWSGHVSMFGVWVDATTGKRFVNELANRKVRSLAILERLNQGHDCLAIGDAGTAASFEEIRPGMLKRQLERGVVFEFKTLEDLAKKFNIPVEALKQTIAEANKAVDTRKDPIGRPVNAKAKKLENGPWYVARMSPKIHHCMGGLYTNEKAQVYHVQGHLIPGLYAAGEATGGVHGAVRLGSCGTADALINGRIAGKQAAAQKPWM